MENITHLISKWPCERDNTSLSVVGNPLLGAGVLIGYTLLGVATYTWAFWYQSKGLKLLRRSCITPYLWQQQIRGVQNIHGPLIAVISMDVVNVITALILASEIAASACSSVTLCFYTLLFCFISRWFAVSFHLVTAYFSLVYLSCPRRGAKLRCTFALIYLMICTLIPFFAFFIQWAVYMMAVLSFGLVLGIIAKCRVPPSSLSAAAEKKWIVIFAVCTFLVVYLPSFVLECIIYSGGSSGKPPDEYTEIYVNILFFTNCHLVMNGALCFLILKLSGAEEEERQQQREPQQRGWQLEQEWRREQEWQEH